MSRFCKCGCGASLDGLRADALYHSDACRKRAKRTPSPDKARKRRQSRDGRGVRIYIAPEDTNLTIDLKVAAARRRMKVGGAF